MFFPYICNCWTVHNFIELNSFSCLDLIQCNMLNITYLRILLNLNIDFMNQLPQYLTYQCSPSLGYICWGWEATCRRTRAGSVIRAMTLGHHYGQRSSCHQPLWQERLVRESIYFETGKGKNECLLWPESLTPAKPYRVWLSVLPGLGWSGLFNWRLHNTSALRELGHLRFSLLLRMATWDREVSEYGKISYLLWAILILA